MREILAVGFPPTLLPHSVLIGGVVPSAIATLMSCLDDIPGMAALFFRTQKRSGSGREGSGERMGREEGGETGVRM